MSGYGMWPKSNLLISVRVCHTLNAVEGNEFDSESIVSALDLQYTINKQWTTSVALSYETVFYPNHAFDRFDQIVSAEAGGRWAVTEKSGLGLRGVIENNHGTVGTGGPVGGYAYNRWNVGLSYDHLILRK